MKKFNKQFNGYDKTEVNGFVDEVTKNYEDMLTSLKERDQQILYLNESLEKYKNLEISLNKALLVAETAANQIKRLAKEESNLIVDEAKKNASRIINNALLKSEQIETDADNLKMKISVYKKRIKHVIEEQLELMDTIDEK